MIEKSVIGNSQDKSPAEIREIIQSALQNNQILGYLKNNILYMKSFGKSYSLDKIFAIIGIVTFSIATEIVELIFSYGIIILTILVVSFSLSFVFAKFFKYYLVYDIDREVFYTITNIHNYTLFKTNEISKKNIIELGVNVSPNDFDCKEYDNSKEFKKKLIDNPHLETSFIALYSNGKTEIISDPISGREPHETAVARCKLFSECFGVKATISQKDEYLLVKKDEFNNYKFEKLTRIPEWEKGIEEHNKTIWITILILISIIVFLIFYFFT